KAASFPLTARARVGNTTQIVPVKLNQGGVVTPIIQKNPSEDKDPYQRNQGGLALGFPLRRDKTFFFGSFERQDIKARQETHFSVPTVAQRGFLGFGATGFNTTDINKNQRIFFPTFIAGDAVFSLFPFPNNPAGPYGENTFSEVLPADAHGTIFSLKFDQELKLLGQSVLTGRYNFTDDSRQVPTVGGAIFSSLEPKVRTQNVSLFLNSQLTTILSNQLRASYGRTQLKFNAIRDPLTIPSTAFPDNPFLINRPSLINLSFPDGDPKNAAVYSPSSRGTEANLGPIGQLIVAPYSPVGLDVYLFPQARANNTIQVADTLTVFKGKHNYKFGTDIRRTQLNSFLDRNFRPQVVFGGTGDLTPFVPGAPIPNLSNNGSIPGLFTGSDLAALGIPTNIFQSIATGAPDSTVGLRFWQYNFFVNDNWRVRPGLTVDYGLRYEYNTVPREVNSRIENTFSLSQLPAADPSLKLAVPFTQGRLTFDTAAATKSFNNTVAALQKVLDGRKEIFDADRNNFGPHIGFAWDPFVGGSQAGKTTVRGGFGVYYDVALGSVVSQSRNVFPTFVPLNFDVNSFFFANSLFYNGESGYFAIFNPSFVPVDVVSGSTVSRSPVIKSGQLNVSGVPSGILSPLLGVFFDPASTTLAGQRLIPSG